MKWMMQLAAFVMVLGCLMDARSQSPSSAKIRKPQMSDTIRANIGERNDLAQRMPQDAQMLKGRLDQYLTAVNAQLPTLNSNYDPSQPVAPRKGAKFGKKGANKK
jgi:hypothetical protein